MFSDKSWRQGNLYNAIEISSFETRLKYQENPTECYEIWIQYTDRFIDPPFETQ